MDSEIKLFRVFIASPGDVAEERQMLRDNVERINAIYAKETEWRIELLGWEDTLLGVGRPQELINADLDKADLFIGCLWQRWGTPSGDGNKTGFEEEFYRALENRKAAGKPEMWLFFKEVPVSAKSDPGPQLRQVIAFHNEQKEKKQLLFKEFKTAPEWQELLLDSLSRRMLTCVTKSAVDESQRTNSAQRSDRPITPPQHEHAEKKREAGFGPLTKALRDAADCVANGDLHLYTDDAILPSSNVVRLLLFAATAYNGHSSKIELGVHEINSVYYYRTELDLTAFERLLAVKSALMDDTLHKPAWFWVKTWKIKPYRWLFWLIKYGSAEECIAAIDFATHIGFSLTMRWQGKPLLSSALEHTAKDVRQAALRHLAALKSAKTLKLAEALLQDEDPDIRAQAERTLRLVKLSADPNHEFAKSVTQNEPFDADLVAVVSKHVDHISDTPLRMALKNPCGELRLLAARTLLSRKTITQEEAEALCSDESRALKEVGYTALVKAGLLPDANKVRSSLTRSYFLSPTEPEWSKADPERVLELLFNELSPKDLWTIVCTFEEDSPLALKAIGKRFWSDWGDDIRANELDGFDRLSKPMRDLRAQIKQPDWRNYLGQSDDDLSSIRKKLTAAALEAMAEHPINDDRSEFTKHLSTDWADFDKTIACLRGLSVVGHPEDLDKIRPLLSSDLQMLEAAACRVFIKLSSSHLVAAKELLSKPSVYRLWALCACLNQNQRKAIWKTVLPLLMHDDPSIRRLACYFAIITFKQSYLNRILLQYLKNSPYYYNVVAILDRQVYAPPHARKFFREQEDAVYATWKQSAAWNWPTTGIK